MNTWPDGKLTKTVNEVAELLSIHRNSLIRWIKSGRIVCTRLGRNSVRFTWDQVADFLESCEEDIAINYPNASKGGE